MNAVEMVERCRAAQQDEPSPSTAAGEVTPGWQEFIPSSDAGLEGHGQFDMPDTDEAAAFAGLLSQQGDL
jgi:hypothetical protein